ncbi:MAG: prolyl endopeptidase-like [Rickettsiaceae bacterium]|jgi:oligopeptidase B|nr:prolyl endopeptidase-like [Rickettsiaceae bacterium]
MLKIIIYLVTLVSIIAGCKDNKEIKAMEAPKAVKREFKITLHNKELVDNYHWLRDPEWPNVKNPEILEYLNAENAHTKNYFDKFKDKQHQIFEELKSRIKLADQSVPIKRDDYYYYTRTLADKDYPIYCRKKGSLDASEEVILDQNELAQGKKFCNIGAFSISPDHKLLGIAIDESGGERFDIRILDLEKKTYLPDFIPSTLSDIVWHEKIPGFFYTPTDEQWRQEDILFHRLGTDYKTDKLVLHEKDPVFRANASKASSKEYIFINVSGHGANEYYVISMDDETFTPHLVSARKDEHFYDMDHNGDYFYIHTNDKGKNFRIARAKTNNFTQDKWEDYIPHDSKKYLKSFDLTKNYLVLNYKEQGLPSIDIIELSDKKKKHINFPDQVFTASAYSTNFKENDIRIEYSSLKRPDTTFNYDFTSENLTTLKVKEIPSGFNPDEYEVERIWADSGDVKVPVTVIYKKALFKKDGANPLYLYGYGSYGHAMPVGFRGSILSLVDRGFVYALAHTRGGDDLGFEWYESAKFLNKKRTFQDFIASAEKLIENKFTSKGNIVIAGGSAGGMLIGAVINERPELFKAAIAHVPFVDVLNTMLDDSLPLTPGEYKEWGNPKEKEYFDYMLSYSPYENIKEQNYPTIFATAGLTDPRVGYWEGAKWVARLREKKTDNNKIFFKINMDAGHRGSSGRFDYLKEVAEEWIFVLDIFKVE